MIDIKLFFLFFSILYTQLILPMEHLPSSCQPSISSESKKQNIVTIETPIITINNNPSLLKNPEPLHNNPYNQDSPKNTIHNITSSNAPKKHFSTPSQSALPKSLHSNLPSSKHRNLSRKDPNKNFLSSSQSTLPKSSNSNFSSPNHHELSRSKSYEPPSLKKQNAKKPFLINFSNSDSTIPSSTKSSKTLILDESAVINAIRNQDIPAIEAYVNNLEENLNQQNKYGNSSLHYAALLKNPTIINLLFSSPETDSSLKNNNNQTASELIQGDDSLPEVRTLLFARLTLDKIVRQETFLMLMNSHIKNLSISNQLIIDTINIIKNKIRKIESSQGGSELPEAALLPKYATDEFIFSMIQSRMSSEQIETQNLIKAIHHETSALLLNVHIDNTMINESVEYIKNLTHDSKKSPKKSPKKSLPTLFPQYATDDFIFQIISSYIKEQKTSIEPLLVQMIPQKISAKK